ncbi:MAG: thioredoxin family protein, partial [Saprospiraceae bacterium]
MRYPLLLLTLLVSPVLRGQGGVQWLEDLSLDAVQVRAAAADRPVVLLFTSSVVMPCTYLEETVLTDPLVAETLREQFVCVRLPVTSAAGEKLLRRFGVEELPSLLFLDARGRLVARRAGVLPVAELALLLQEVDRPANHLVPLA